MLLAHVHGPAVRGWVKETFNNVYILQIRQIPPFQDFFKMGSRFRYKTQRLTIIYQNNKLHFISIQNFSILFFEWQLLFARLNSYCTLTWLFVNFLIYTCPSDFEDIIPLSSVISMILVLLLQLPYSRSLVFITKYSLSLNIITE